nr:MAG TPA: hypothetical protein [Caudoviricetes sp.]
MSRQKFALTFIFLLILVWVAQVAVLLFFTNELNQLGNGRYHPHNRFINPAITGGLVLWFWWKMKLKNTGAAFLGFAVVLAAVLIYMLATMPEPEQKPTIICDENNKNCRPHPIYGK